MFERASLAVSVDRVDGVDHHTHTHGWIELDNFDLILRTGTNSGHWFGGYTLREKFGYTQYRDQRKFSMSISSLPARISVYRID